MHLVQLEDAIKAFVANKISYIRKARDSVAGLDEAETVSIERKLKKHGIEIVNALTDYVKYLNKTTPYLASW